MALRGARPLRARLSLPLRSALLRLLRNQLLAGALISPASRLHLRQLRRGGRGLLLGPRVHVRNRALDCRGGHRVRLRVRLRNPLQGGSLGPALRVRHPDHALRRLSRQDLRVEDHPRQRRDPQYSPDRARDHQSTALLSALQSRGDRAHPRPLADAARGPADPRVVAGHRGHHHRIGP